MGCASSNSKTIESTTAVETKTTKPPNSSARNKTSTIIPPESANTSTTAIHSEAHAATSSSMNPSAETKISPAAAPTPAAAAATAADNNKATVGTKKSIAAPAPGVKHVRGAYSGKGWAPPQKEWETNSKQKGDKTTIEIEDEWDDDGNLQRTTIKHTTTPDWKKTTEKTIEIIPAEEAEKMGLGRK